MHVLASRPTYTRHQLAQYVARLQTPTSGRWTLEDLESSIKADPLAALSALQKKQMSFVSWGNVAMHYSPHRALPLDTESLFTKLVERGLGGYCMENNTFFATVLRSLGYELYTSGARISNSLDMSGKDPDGFSGW